MPHDPAAATLKSGMTAFASSRIYAQGWNAARTGSGRTADSNPYPSEPERSRWNEGFTQAQR